MHIPDGYISPQSCGILYALCAPLWWFSARRIKRALPRRRVPLLGILAAFSFLIMMFNIPLPGGTTGHATGGVLIAVLIGPWPALMAVSLTLAVQALFFGDGGLLALGANVFNLGFVMPFAGYAVYRLVRGSAGTGGTRFTAAAAAGGFVGINAAALLVAFELGIQPALHHLPGGTPLYCPYTLSVTLPAMMIPHLTVGGLAEALITGGVLAFLGRYHPELFDDRAPETGAARVPGTGPGIQPPATQETKE